MDPVGQTRRMDTLSSSLEGKIFEQAPLGTHRTIIRGRRPIRDTDK
jgi:hypothetical protein